MSTILPPPPKNPRSDGSSSSPSPAVNDGLPVVDRPHSPAGGLGFTRTKKRNMPHLNDLRATLQNGKKLGAKTGRGTFRVLKKATHVSYGAVTKATNNTVGAVTHVTNVSVGALGKATNASVGAVTHVTSGAVGAVTHVTTASVGVIGKATNASVGAVTHVTSGAVGAVTHVTSGAVGAVTNATTASVGVIGKATNASVGAVSHVTSGAVGAVTHVTSASVGAIGKATNASVGAVTHVTSGAVGAVTHVTNASVGAIGKATNKSVGAIGKATNASVGAVTHVANVSVDSVAKATNVSVGAVTKAANVSFGSVRHAATTAGSLMASASNSNPLVASFRRMNSKEVELVQRRGSAAFSAASHDLSDGTSDSVLLWESLNEDEDERIDDEDVTASIRLSSHSILSIRRSINGMEESTHNEEEGSASARLSSHSILSIRRSSHGMEESTTHDGVEEETFHDSSFHSTSHSEWDDHFDLESCLLKLKNDFPIEETFDDTYSVGKSLGQGSFGSVMRCTSTKSAGTYAVKSVPIEKYDPEEIDILKDLQFCPQIVQIEEVFVDHPKDAPAEEANIMIVMEEIAGGQLLDRIAYKECYAEKEAKELFRTLLETVQFCHSEGIAHCDIKPENIMLTSLANDTDIKLVDFGLARRFQTKTDGATIRLMEMHGSPEYAAPEVFNRDETTGGDGYDERCDIWSLGVVLYVLLGGYAPFEAETDHPDDMIRAVAQGKIKFHKRYWKGISREAKILIARMLTVDPNKRISLEEALASPWFLEEDQQRQEEAQEQEEKLASSRSASPVPIPCDDVVAQTISGAAICA